MAKQVFFAGGLEAEDYSYLKALYYAAKAAGRLDLWGEPAPVGFEKRIDEAPAITPDSSQAYLIAKEQQVLDLQEQIASKDAEVIAVK